MDGRRAIIDIGSNTVRLVVYNGPTRAPVVLLNEKVTARLGREVARTGMLGDKAVASALASLARYRALLGLMDVEDIEVAATAAVRDAENGQEFLQSVATLGFAPRLLSGAEEARVSALGVIAAFPGAKGTTADLGGGSLELTAIADGAPHDGISLPLGTLRLPALRDKGGKFPARIAAMVVDAGWRGGRGEPLYLVGGSLRAFALSAMLALDWPIDDPHGFEIAPEDALALSKPIAAGEIAHVSRISSSRLATLPDTAALLHALVRAIEPSHLVFSSWGLREGLLYDRLDAATRMQDPFIAGVAAFAGSEGVVPGAAQDLFAWTAPAASTPPGDEALRLAACHLALAAMRSEPNLRGDQAMGWALRKRWIALDARGRAMLALAVLANTGETAIPDVFRRLAREEDLRAAIGWGLAIRLCRRLTARAPDAMAATVLAREGGTLTLSLAEPLHALYTDAMGKDLRALAAWTETEPAVEFRPAV